MATETPTFPLAKVFSNLFRGFPRLLLTNLLFAVPLAFFYAVFYAVNTLTQIHSNFILLLTIIPVFPFYAGVVQVSAHIARGEEQVVVFANFLAAVKENFLRFLVHGVVFYLAVFFSYWSITLYFGMGKQNPMFYALMVISILIAVFFLFIFYYVPSMTITFDIKMKDIYKNSVLMSFGEFKQNLIATFGLFLLAVICSSVLMCCGGNAVAIIIATAAMMLLLVPSVAAYIINAAIFRRMYLMIIDRDAQRQEIDKKMSDKRSEIADRKNGKKSAPPVDEDLKKLEIDASADGDEYIYYHGRMVKRSVLLKLQQEAKESESE